MEQIISTLEQILEEYRRDLEEYAKNRRTLDGVFGFGRSLRNDPCHERFDEKVRKAVEAFAAEEPSPSEAEEAVRFLLSWEAKDLPDAAKWMLGAEERHSLPLIPRIGKEAADALYPWYKKRYRPWERMPVQKEVLKALKVAAGK